MSNFRKSILIFGAVLLCVCAALATFLVLYFSGALVTEPIELVYQIVDERKDYDGEPLTPQECLLMSGSLIEGHVAEISMEGVQTIAGTSKSSASVKIFDENGYDVTNDYKIRVEPGTLTVNRQELYVSLNSEQVVYSGDKIVFDNYSIAQGKLASGHTVGATFAGVGVINVGDTLARTDLFPAVYDALGRDVSSNYLLAFKMDPVVVIPRPITLTPVSVDKVYDGEPVALKTEITAGTLVTGHYCAFTYTDAFGNEANLENAGSMTVFANARVYDPLGNDVTANYSINDSATAVLTVRKRALTVTGESFSWEYDGKAHSGEGAVTNEETDPASAEGLATGESVRVIYSGTITVPGERENRIASCRILDKEGFDASLNYDITYVSGKLTVTKANLTVSLKDIEKTFDGKPYEAKQQSDYYEFSPVLPEGVVFDSNVEEELSSVTAGKGIKYIFTDYSLTKDEEDLTQFYEVTVIAGTLTISPIQVSLNAEISGALSTEYSGTFCTLPHDSFKANGLLAGHTIVSVTGDKVLYPSAQEQKIGIGAVKIADAAGRDVTDGYEFTNLDKVNINVLVGKKKVTVSVADYTCEYGEKITPEFLKSLLVCEEPFTAADFSFELGEVKHADIYPLTPKFEGKELGNYEPRIVAGTLTIQPKKISVTVSGEKSYDGLPLSKEDITLQCDLPEGVTAEIDGSLTNAGEYTAIIFRVDGKESFDYEAVVTGSYKITKRTAYLKYDENASRSKTYDGTPFAVDYQFLKLVDEAGKSLDGFEITSVTYDSIVRATTEAQPLNLRYPKAVLKGGDGAEISAENLEIIIAEEDEVSVTVNRRAITFTVAPLTISKDATDDDVPFDLSSLVTVNGIASTDYIGSRIYNISADLESDILMVSRRSQGRIYNAFGEDVTDCYTIPTNTTGVITRV